MDHPGPPGRTRADPTKEEYLNCIGGREDEWERLLYNNTGWKKPVTVRKKRIPFVMMASRIPTILYSGLPPMPLSAIMLRHVHQSYFLTYLHVSGCHCLLIKIL